MEEEEEEEEEHHDEEKPQSEKEAGLHVLVSNDSDLCSFGEMEWFCIDTVMDSGAADPVAPIEMLDWIPLKESEGSRRGQTWQAAGGEVIPNMGERKVEGYTEEGAAVESIYQVGAISKMLGSVARTCDKGNRVVFEAGGGYIQNLSSGACTQFGREQHSCAQDLGAAAGWP